MSPRHNGDRGPDTPQYRIDLVVRHLRRLLELGHTIEECLDLVVEAARQEFQCRIVIVRPSAENTENDEQLNYKRCEELMRARNG
jgi:hypothetical protein